MVVGEHNNIINDLLCHNDKMKCIDLQLLKLKLIVKILSKFNNAITHRNCISRLFRIYVFSR